MACINHIQAAFFRLYETPMLTLTGHKRIESECRDPPDLGSGSPRHHGDIPD
jgi:hypothetical protein